ncbi:tetratricopeptide repeat protein [Rheinheimera nanhaiensis]|nr:tetratricopeptide repeat protein [Rheinheimera nanhaiensis]
MTSLLRVNEIKQLLSQGLLAQAERDCRDLLQVNPEIAEGWFLLAQIAMHHNKADAALECIKRAVNIDHQNSHYMIYNAFILSVLADYDQAYHMLKPIMPDSSELSVQQLFGRVAW